MEYRSPEFYSRAVQNPEIVDVGDDLEFTDPLFDAGELELIRVAEELEGSAAARKVGDALLEAKRMKQVEYGGN